MRILIKVFATTVSFILCPTSKKRRGIAVKRLFELHTKAVLLGEWRAYWATLAQLSQID